MIHKNQSTSIGQNGIRVTHTQSVMIDGIEDVLILSNLCQKFIKIRELIDTLEAQNTKELLIKIDGNTLRFSDSLSLFFSDQERQFLKELGS